MAKPSNLDGIGGIQCVNPILLREATRLFLTIAGLLSSADSERTSWAMIAIPQEFEFLPAELLFKVGRFVRSYYDAHGDESLWAPESQNRANTSPYLRDMGRVVAWRRRFMWGAGEFALLYAIGAALWSLWLLAPFVICGIATFYFYRLVRSGILLERALILASEMLATDFANWGTAFPKQKREAEKWLSALGQTKRFLEIYPSLKRTDVIDAFRPSLVDV